MKHRWVWMFGWSLAAPAELDEMERVLRRAAQSGCNGVVFTMGLDRLSRQSPPYHQLLQRLLALCAELGLEFVPAVFSPGRGDWLFSLNPNLAEGVPVVAAPFRVQGSRARLHSPGPRALLQQPVGVLPGQPWRGPVEVQPRRCYRLELRLRCQQPCQDFRVQVRQGRRRLPQRKFSLQPHPGVQQLSMVFNSLGYSQLELLAGLWSSGQLQLESLSLEEVGPVNLLQRSGTPCRVTSHQGQVEYEAGRDYQWTGTELDLSQDGQPALELALLPGSRIQPDQALEVSWYHALILDRDQVTVCLAEPEFYRHFREAAEWLIRLTRPRHVFLACDEIRMAGNCQSCRGQDVGHLLSQCVQRQVDILQELQPGLGVAFWADMFDPHANGHDHYYLIEGDLSGSGVGLNRDWMAVIWGREPRPESLQHFRERGQKTMVACFYDAEGLEEVRQWAQLAGREQSYMFTSWAKNYDCLPEFWRTLDL